jgi:site-specific DNA-adenine methylase
MESVPHKTYIEANVGMGNICLNFPTSAERIVNDANIDNALLFKTLASDYNVTSAFLNYLEGAEYCKDSFDKAYAVYRKMGLDRNDNKLTLDDFEGDKLARIGAALYVLFRTSYCGQITGCFLKPDSYSEIDNFTECLYDLPDIIERMQGVRVLNMDAVDLVEMYKDDSDAFIFADPPYYPDDSSEAKSERSKNAENSYRVRLDYDAFIKALRTSKSKIMLCNYNSNYLQLQLVDNGWKMIEIGERTIDCAMKKGSKFRETSTEYIYINF